jgi:hypothetical protein
MRLMFRIIPTMQKSAPHIVQVEWSMPRPKPLGLFDHMPLVVATFDDGVKKELFSFYPDEISFGEGELVGLTEAEAHALRRQKDVAYLRAP